MKKKTVLAIVAGIFVLWVLSGVYVTGSRERAVLLRFGKVVQNSIPPGIHYHLPYPIEEIRNVAVTEVRTASIEFEKPLRPRRSSYLLTGDENVVKIRLSIHYRVAIPDKFLFASLKPEQIMKRTIEAECVNLMAQSPVDDILTTGKGALASKIRTNAQKRLDELGLGIVITSLLIPELVPPREVQASFKDVASAREDKNRRINEVEGQRNRKLPRARGEASRIIENAKAYAAEVKAKANGEAQRFIDALKAYRKNPSDVRQKLYYSYIQQIFQSVKTMIVDPKSTARIQITPKQKER